MKVKKILYLTLVTAAICILSGISAAAEEYDPDIVKTTEAAEYDENKITQLDENDTEIINDWIYENGKQYYFKNGEKIVEFCHIDGNDYYFAANGTAKSGWYTIDGVRMYFSPDTYQRQFGWLEYNGNLFYLDEKGKAVGKNNIDGKDYIFDEYGICSFGWFEYEDGKYYSDFENGLYKNQCEIDGEKYCFSSGGRFQSGWVTLEGKRIFYDYDTAKPIYGFINYNGNIYYSDREKGKITGEFTINGIKYRFDKYGCQQTGMQKFSDGTRYYDQNGKAIKGFLNLNGNTYYFDSSYLMKTGWQTVNGKKYYINNQGIVQTGFQTISEKKYYFDKSGIMQTGWQTVGGKKYYFDKNGVMYTGWQKIDDKYYFLGQDGALQEKTPKVFVGVGHGGYDPGAIGYIVEKEYTFKTAQIVASLLKAAGIEFMLSRTADIDTTMESKLKLCNDYDPDLIIDIHFNAVGGNGFEVYHSQYGGMSLTLAQNINEEVSKIMKSNGCKIMLYPNGTDRFTIIRETHAPSVLLEGGYVDNYYDAEFIKANYMKLAKAYVEGVLKTLGQIMLNRK